MLTRQSKIKRAFVSGSTSGIGLCITKRLLEEGYFVWINGRDMVKGKSVFSQLQQTYENVEFLAGDVSDDRQIQEIRDHLLRKNEKLDLIVANAGSGRCVNNLLVDRTEFQRVFDINFFSTVNVCQYLQPLLSDSANIVCISSIAGVTPLGAPVPYACAKAAINMFVKEWAMRLANQNIRVNSISPGNVMFPGSVWDQKMQKDSQGVQSYIEANVPSNGFVTPEEIAESVLYLCKTPSLTGQNIVVDGGQCRGQS